MAYLIRFLNHYGFYRILCFLGKHLVNANFNHKALAHPKVRGEIDYYKCYRCKKDWLVINNPSHLPVDKKTIKQILQNKRNYEFKRREKRKFQRGKGRRKVLFEKYDPILAKRNKRKDVYED